jgi:hypothetical protein
MESKFKENEFVKHFEAGVVYEVVEVLKGKFQFFYILKTEDRRIIETPFREIQIVSSI